MSIKVEENKIYWIFAESEEGNLHHSFSRDDYATFDEVIEHYKCDNIIITDRNLNVIIEINDGITIETRQKNPDFFANEDKEIDAIIIFSDGCMRYINLKTKEAFGLI